VTNFVIRKIGIQEDGKKEKGEEASVGKGQRYYKTNYLSPQTMQATALPNL